MMGFGMMGGGLFGLLFMGLIVYLIVSLFNNNGTFNNTMRDNPLEILKERYARGEISEEEYEEKRKLLKR